MDDVAKVLIGGIPTLLVALIGLIGVIVTQARADSRQDRIATAARQFQRDTELLGKRREAAAEFIAAAMAIVRHRRVNPSDHLGKSEFESLDRAHSKLLILLDPNDRTPANAVTAALDLWLKPPAKQDFNSVETAILDLINTVQRA